MDLLERFSSYCFRRRLRFFVDSGTLLGIVRHRAIIHWDYDVDLGMHTADYQRLVQEFDNPPGLRLALDWYEEPDACLCVVPEGSLAEGHPFLDVCAYAPDGRALMSDALQRKWPLDLWRRTHTERSWTYDFGIDAVEPLVGLPAWCDLFHAPAGWQGRLDRHYDSWHARPESLARAARDLPFDPAVPAVRLIPEYAKLADGFRETGGLRPFVVRECPGFDLDAQRLGDALCREPSRLRGYFFDGPKETDERIPLLDPAETWQRFRAGTLEVNVTESTVTLLPRTALPRALHDALDPGDEYALSYVLTPDRTETPFHWDRKEGGGYLHLIEGEKFWWFVPGGEGEMEGLWGRSMTDILTSDGFRLWGRVEVVHQRAGDLVVFPVGWCHRVRTHRAALGVGGYLRVPAATIAPRSS